MLKNQNINKLIEFDLTVTTITLIVDRSCPDNWTHEQKLNRNTHGIVFILEGSAVFTSSDKAFIACKGDIVFLPKDSKYSTSSIFNSGYHFITASFHVDNNDTLNQFPLGVLLKAHNESFYRNLFKDLANSWYYKALAYKLQCKGILHQILFQLFSDSIKERTHSLNFTRIQPAITFIDKNFEKELNVGELCNLCQLSATHFRRLFKEVCGVSPNEYLNSVRIAKAKDLLLSNVYMVWEVADKTGFSDMCYFSRCFKKATGKSPSDFQKSML